MLPCAVKLLLKERSKSGEGVEGVKEQAVISPRNKRTACLTAFIIIPSDPIIRSSMSPEAKQGKRAKRSRISGAADKFLGESVNGWEIDGPLEGHHDHGVIP